MASDMKASLHRFRLRQASPTDTSNAGPGPPSSPRRRRSASPKSAAAPPVGGRPGGGGGRHAIPACDRCRSFKKKCSRTFPVCALCTNAGQKCSYSSPTSTAEGQVLQLGARVQWLSRYINENLMGASGQDGAGIEAIETGTDLLSLLGAPVTGSSPASLPYVRQQQCQETTSPHGDMAVGQAISKVHDVSGSTDPPSLIGRQSIDVRVDENGVPSPLDPGSVGASGSHASYQGSVGTDGSKGFGSKGLPADAAARRFVDAYFRNVNRAYPFVNQSKVLADLDAPGEFIKRRRDARSTLLYLVMAIGCTTLERAGQIPRDTARRFDVSYSDIIQECLCRESIESIQILVLLALYSLFDPAGTSSYSIVGIAARQAILSGLSRRPADELAQAPAEVELRHRLYWSIFVLDRMMAVSQGLPVALTDDNADVPLPGLTIDEFASPERTTYARNLQTSRHVIQLRQLEDRILRHVHFCRRADVAELTAPDRRATVAAIRADVEDWYSNGCLMSPMEPDNVPIHSSITWLSARYYHLLLLIYYPNHFNASAGAVSRGELLQFVRRQLQSTSALFQQRQLPLNRVTLCRLFPVTLVLMHDFAASCAEAVENGGGDYSGGSNGAGSSPYQARDEVAVLISILEAFPEAWVLAHQAAQVVRQFAGVISGGVSGAAYFSQQSVYPLSGGGAGAGGAGNGVGGSAARDRVHELVKPCIAGLTTLMQQMLGKTTCFQFIEYPSDERGSEVVRGNGNVGFVNQQQSTMSPVPPNRAIMNMPQLSMGDDAVMNYGWGLDLDFL